MVEIAQFLTAKTLCHGLNAWFPRNTVAQSARSDALRSDAGGWQRILRRESGRDSRGTRFLVS